MNSVIALHSAERPGEDEGPNNPPYHRLPSLKPQRPSLMTQLAARANDDTPANVEVPATVSGLTQYVLGRWGPWGAILCFVVVLWLAYSQSVQQTITIQKDQITAQQKTIDAMEIMIQTMDRAVKAEAAARAR